VNIPSEVLAAHLGDEAVLLDLTAKRYYRLNESAAVVFRALEEGEGRDGAIRRLIAAFEVSEPDAASAVDALLADFAARGLVARPVD
jgi:hypothetical protein